MPTYEYECRRCAHRFEVTQRISDDPLTTCDECGGRLRKVFHPVGIAFRGSGFYVTDSRSSSTGENGAGEKKPAAEKAGSREKAGSGEKAASGETASKPKGRPSPSSEKSA